MVVIVDEDVKEMARLEHAMQLSGFSIACFKFTNLNEAVNFIFVQPDPIDYLLVDVDTVLPEEEWLLKTLASFGESPNMVTVAYSKNREKDVVALKKRLATHMVVTLPTDSYKYIGLVGHILVFHELEG